MLVMIYLVFSVAAAGIHFTGMTFWHPPWGQNCHFWPLKLHQHSFLLGSGSETRTSSFSSLYELFCELAR